MPATYEPIATTTLGSAAASITFSSISSAYTDLRVVLVTTNTASGVPTLRLNADSGSNYSRTALYGTGSSALSFRTSNAVQITPTGADTPSTTIPTLVTYDIFAYAGNTNKTILVSMANDKNGSGENVYSVGLWRNTSAVTSILLARSADNYATGTTATIYGILKA